MAIIHSVNMSGVCNLKIDRPIDTGDWTEGIACKLGITPNDVPSLIGKRIYITFQSGTNVTTHPLNIYGKSFAFEYFGVPLLICGNNPDTPDVDDWTIVEF